MLINDNIPASSSSPSETPPLEAGNQTLDLGLLPLAVGVVGMQKAAPLLLPILLDYPFKGNGVVEANDFGSRIREAQDYPYKVGSIIMGISVLESASVKMEQAHVAFAEHSRPNEVAIGLGVKNLPVKAIRSCAGPFEGGNYLAYTPTCA